MEHYSSIIFVILLATTYGLPTEVTTTTDAPETTTQKVLFNDVFDDRLSHGIFW